MLFRKPTYLIALGWRVHKLDQCVFILYDGDELIGLFGVYVDDFLIAGKLGGNNNPRDPAVVIKPREKISV